MKRVLKEVDGSGWLGALGIWWALYIYLWTWHAKRGWWWKVFTVSIVLYEDVDPLLCDAELASDTVRAVFDVTRELEYEVKDLVVELMIEAI